MFTRRAPSVLRFVRAFATSRPPPRKLLRPYDLALQLKQLSADGNVDAAVQRLQSVPRDAQNVPAWNTMLSLCMSHKKFQLAYALFIDMKRRGFSPNISTFVTMFKGLSQIDDWSNHPKQLANAHALYHYYLAYTLSIKHHDPGNVAQLSLSPLVIYISILGAAGDFQKMFDVYFAMDQDGPHAPNKFVFTAMLRAITNQQERAGVMSVRDATASDAKHVWLQIEKTMQKCPDFELDSRLIAASIHALTRGRPADQNLALDIIAQHLGLTRPGHADPFKLSPHLNYWTLDAALQVCLSMQKFRLCVHFMHLIMDNLDFDRPGVRSIAARSHIHKLLRAHASLAMLASPHESSQAIDALEWCLKNDAIYDIPDLRPDLRTYHFVLVTCFRTGDWEGAIKSFQLMTGIQTDSFNESEGKAPPRVQKRPEGRSLAPNVETMSFIMRTALQTKDNTKALQALWLSEYVGIDRLLQDKVAEPYYRASFTRALASVIDQLLHDPRTEHRREWLASLKARAKEVIRTVGHTLRRDKSTLGTMTTLTQEDGAVSFDLVARSSKPRSN
ncbi:hypothetical protein L210DRAFT_2406687 [Boletus edulis BED1]|uniref:Pentatricopeptide repeat protein n=1 Tax=Boletus edulis BED1 TaxID=1328754 RepID=A0AAD4GL94_BOLED|nr:hypothetical protein L210DRAFT_2406687 [Boletus edulis BED1]